MIFNQQNVLFRDEAGYPALPCSKNFHAASLMNFFYKNFFIYHKISVGGDWGLGIGDWGLGIGDWGLGPIPNPQSPIPNPQIRS
jgi:hypothetical protein